MTVMFVICFSWMIFNIRVYLPGSVIAEAVYVDKDGFYGYDTLRYVDENGEEIIFNHISDGKKIMASSGDKVIVAGEIVSYNEGAAGEENSSLIIVPIWLACIIPALSVVFLCCAILSLKRYLKQKNS